MKKDFLKRLRAANIERDNLWDPNRKIDTMFRALELAGEVGELCNDIKKLKRAELGLKGSRTSLCSVSREIADVLVTLDLLAMNLEIDLETAVTEKFNHTSNLHKFSTQL